MTLPGTIGRGWLLNVGYSSDLASAGIAPTGLHIPTGNLADRAAAITMVDRDGTRHVFRPRILNQLAPATGAFAPVGATAPRDEYTHLCVDVAYDARPASTVSDHGKSRSAIT